MSANCSNVSAVVLGSGSARRFSNVPARTPFFRSSRTAAASVFVVISRFDHFSRLTRTWRNLAHQA
ncbi:MAG: hypothetical protein DMF84_00765 [Acidobacteria bacterium]|nr:MAG: hypothetical protein DMF84_00765 [Acidobacteriota bacterium]